MACSRTQRMKSLLNEIGDVSDKQYAQIDMYIHEKVFPEYTLYKRANALSIAMGGTLDQRKALVKEFTGEANGNTFKPLLSSLILAKEGKHDKMTPKQAEVYSKMVDVLTQQHAKTVTTEDIKDKNQPKESVKETEQEETNNEPTEYFPDTDISNIFDSGDDINSEFNTSFEIDDTTFTQGSTASQDAPNRLIEKKVGVDIDGIFETVGDMIMLDKQNGHYIPPDYMSKIEERLGDMLDLLEDVNPDFTVDINLHITDGGSRGSITQDVNSKVSNGDTVIDIFKNENDKSTPMSSILIHELFHAFAKGAIKQNPKLAKDAERLRDALRQSGTVTVDTFLQGYSDAGITINNEILIQAKHKFEYVMGKYSDIEEFMAYALSDRHFENALLKSGSIANIEMSASVKMEELAESLGGFAVFVNSLKEMMSDIISAIKELFTGELTDSSAEIIGNIIQDISDTHTKGLISTNSNVLNAIRASDIKTYLHKEFPIVLDTADKTIEAFKKYGYTPSKATILKGFKKTTRGTTLAVSKISNSAVGDGIRFLGTLPLIKDALDTRIVKDIYRQVFDNTSSGDFVKLYDLHRDTKLINEKFINDQHNIITTELIASEIGAVGNTKHIQNLADTVFSTGMILAMHRFDKFDENTFNKIMEYLGDKYTKRFEANHAVKELVANIVRHDIDPSHKSQEDSLASLSLTSTDASFLAEYIGMLRFNALPKDKRELAFETFNPKSYKKRNNLDKEEARKRLNKFTVEMKTISDMYIEEYEDVLYKLPSTPISAFATGIDDKTVIGYLHEDELSDGMPLNTKIVGKSLEENSIIIGDSKYFRVAFTNGSIGFDDGLFNVVGFKQDSMSVGNMLRNSLVKTYHGDTEKAYEEYHRILSLFENGVDISKYVKTKKNLVAKRDFTGAIVDIIIPTSDIDAKSLGSNTDFIGRIASTISRLKNRKTAEEQNTKVIKLLDLAYTQHVAGKKYKNTKFIEVSPHKNVQLWNLLSDTIRADIRDRKQLVRKDGKTKDTTLYVPDSMLEMVFGTRTASLSNLTVKNTTLGLINSNDKIFGSERAKRTIVAVENIAKAILGEIKSATVLFNTEVFTGNMVSNMHITYSYGIDPLEYTVEFTKGWAMLNRYEEMNRELIRLKLFHPQQVSIIKDLTERLNKSPVAALVKDGQFTPMVDGYDSADAGRISGFFADKFLYDADIRYDSKLERDIAIEAYNRASMSDAPIKSYAQHERDVREEFKQRGGGMLGQGVKNTLFTLYGSHGTGVYKKAQKAVLYGDALSKQMIIDKMKKDGKINTDADMKRLLRKLDKQFVNYSYNSSGLMSWIEKVGGLHFAKYLLRHAKGYAEVVKDNPTSVIAQQGAEYVFDTDFSDPTDTLFDHTIVDNIINREQALKPLETIHDMLTPNLVEII